MEEKLNNVKEILKKFNQEQLLANYEKLNNEKKEILLEQIMQIDFEQIKELYDGVGKISINKNVNIEAIPFIEKNKIEDLKYFEKGKKCIAEGKLAIVTMAGGQGTRLRT